MLAHHLNIYSLVCHNAAGGFNRAICVFLFFRSSVYTEGSADFCTLLRKMLSAKSTDKLCWTNFEVLFRFVYKSAKVTVEQLDLQCHAVFIVLLATYLRLLSLSPVFWYFYLCTLQNSTGWSRQLCTQTFLNTWKFGYGRSPQVNNFYVVDGTQNEYRLVGKRHQIDSISS